MADFNAYPALSVNPTAFDIGKADLTTNQIIAGQQSNALFPLRQQAYQTEIDQAQQNLQANDNALEQADLARAVEISGDDPDEWQRQMQSLAKRSPSTGKPNKQAQQYVDRPYTPALGESLRKVYGGALGAAKGAPRGAAGAQQAEAQQTGNELGFLPGLPGYDQGQMIGFGQQYGKDPNAFRDYQTKQDHVISELERVTRLPQDQAVEAWKQIQAQDPEAAKLGEYNPQRFLQMLEAMKARRAQLTTALPGTGPAPTPPSQVTKVGNDLVQMTPRADGGVDTKIVASGDKPINTGMVTKEGYPISMMPDGTYRADKNIQAAGGRGFGGAGRIGKDTPLGANVEHLVEWGMFPDTPEGRTAAAQYLLKSKNDATQRATLIQRRLQDIQKDYTNGGADLPKDEQLKQATEDVDNMLNSRGPGYPGAPVAPPAAPAAGGPPPATGGNTPPPGVPKGARWATNPKGDVVYWNGKAWVPVKLKQ